MWGGSYACGAELCLCVCCACLRRCWRAHAPLCCAAATCTRRLVRRILIVLCGGRCLAAGLAFRALHAHARRAFRRGAAGSEWPPPPAVGAALQPALLLASPCVCCGAPLQQRSLGRQRAAQRTRWRQHRGASVGVVSLLHGGWLRSVVYVGRRPLCVMLAALMRR